MDAPDNCPPRSAWTAALLSLLCTGLGHVYVGMPLRGLGLFLGSLMLTPVLLFAAWLNPSDAVLILIFTAVGALIFVYLFAVADSWRQARRQTMTAPSPIKHPGLYALFIAVGLTYPLGSTWLVRSVAFEAFYCPAASMVPTILPGDRLLANKLSLNRRSMQRGDLIVHLNPEDRHQHFIKRVVGLPGDVISVKRNEVSVNGKTLARDPAPQETLVQFETPIDGDLSFETVGQACYLIRLSDNASAPVVEALEVPAGTCFVLGDNRGNSRDSRSFGCVPLGDVVGIAEYLFYPANSWTRLGML